MRNDITRLRSNNVISHGNVYFYLLSIFTKYLRLAESSTHTPRCFCITYDFESENDGAVTVRDRDTMEQVRVKIEELEAYFADKFTF